jgi:hypothetical protein
VMADSIAGGLTSVVNLSGFSLERFSGGIAPPPWSETEYLLSADFGHTF